MPVMGKGGGEGSGRAIKAWWWRNGIGRDSEGIRDLVGIGEIVLTAELKGFEPQDCEFQPNRLPSSKWWGGARSRGNCQAGVLQL